MYGRDSDGISTLNCSGNLGCDASSEGEGTAAAEALMAREDMHLAEECGMQCRFGDLKVEGMRDLEPEEGRGLKKVLVAAVIGGLVGELLQGDESKRVASELRNSNVYGVGSESSGRIWSQVWMGWFISWVGKLMWRVE
ncbi:unnamed protein product [Linum tenue]|uniref:Uncharacterized protein n=1 Tax=Linum tenue TaxID=586396 RepID=A0AAV0RFQ2_9ROSI|nr:unnamed protein product [Linum tenue]